MVIEYLFIAQEVVFVEDNLKIFSVETGVADRGNFATRMSAHRNSCQVSI